jgi:hypothetical protein
LNGNMQQFIEAGQTQQVQKVAKQIMEVSKKMGPAGAKKTMLANSGTRIACLIVLIVTGRSRPSPLCQTT